MTKQTSDFECEILRKLDNICLDTYPLLFLAHIVFFLAKARFVYVNVCVV